MKDQITLLIVDDDPDDREMFIECAEAIDASVKCLSAKSGTEMLQILNQGILPHCIFLDLNMPGMTGMQCLAELKKTKEWQNIPIVIYTTSGDQNTQMDCLKNGASHFLTKPNSFNSICEAIKGVLKDLRVAGH